MSTQPLLQRTAKKRIALPVRVEPKVFFANERTFLSWLHFAVVLGGLAVGLLNFGDKVGRISAAMYTIIAYVDDQLLATGKISKAAILGKAGGVWATSSGYTLSQAEQDFVTKTAFTSPDSVQGTGITLNGFKFMTLRAGPDEVLGRKGERGVVIIPTTQAILVGEYDGTPAGDANVVVAKLADYLKSVGY
ncbi:Vacuolar transporter chaperone 1 [Vanrija pseudolonga]|uniref:Profilin n=1 Tax=Vanrija pseudolonga TaxID=143232 RepID=A0AAF0Y864_9TREE|nr:Vacuolar transporter chaperone 1 [Vanrija pseudolonga]